MDRSFLGLILDLYAERKECGTLGQMMGGYLNEPFRAYRASILHPQTGSVVCLGSAQASFKLRRGRGRGRCCRSST